MNSTTRTRKTTRPSSARLATCGAPGGADRVGADRVAVDADATSGSPSEIVGGLVGAQRLGLHPDVVVAGDVHDRRRGGVDVRLSGLLRDRVADLL